MAQTFELLPEPRHLTVAAGGSGRVTFTLTNTKAEAMDVQLSVDAGGAPPPWLTLEGPALRPVAAKGVQSIVVVANPPAGTAPTALPVKLVAASTTSPEDDWAASPEVTVQVGAGAAGPKPWPWVIAAVVLILGIAIGVTVWLMSSSGGGLLAACGTEQACREGLDCVGGACMIPNARACKQDEHCASGFCAPETKLCEPRLAGPGDACAELACVEGFDCVERTGVKLCQADAGADCADDRECKTGFCNADEGCARPPVHTTCPTDGAECYPGQTCKRLEGTNPPQRLCFWADGEACSQDNECAGGWCKGKVCRTYDGSCQGRSDCRSGYQCHRGTCLLPNGASCDDNLDCISANCSNRQCKSRASPVNRCIVNGRPKRCPKFQRCVPSTGRCRAYAGVRDINSIVRDAVRADAFIKKQSTKKAQKKSTRVQIRR